MRNSMRIPRFVLILMMFLLSAQTDGRHAYAEDASSAKASLEAVLSDEFLGAEGAWAGRAIYTDPHQEFVGDCNCRFPRGLFDLASSPMLIVEKWYIDHPASPAGGGDLSFQVTFLVVARTSGEGSASWVTPEGRTIVPLKKPALETEKYVLREDNGAWKVLDPKLPHVGLAAEREAIDNDISKYEHVLKDLPGGADPRRLRNLQNLISWLARQRVALQKVEEHG